MRINQNIKVDEVRLIDAKGENLGVYKIQDAFNKASESHLDLVEISPDSSPPVCRIMDYGKFQFDQKKKLSGIKKNRKASLKEIKFRPSTDIGDYKVKMRHLQKFIEGGDKVKVSVWFRGREIMYKELGLNLIEKIESEVKSFANIESEMKMEGRQMFVMLSPMKGAVKKAPQVNKEELEKKN